MHDPIPDRTLSFLSDPYHFIARQCRLRGIDTFETRLLLEKTVCLTGSEAARMFYGESRLKREGAAPEPVQATLFGKGGLQQLDGAAHHARKVLFLTLLAPGNVARLARRVRRYWGDFDRWAPRGYQLPLYETAQHVLALSVCEWLGVPVRRGNLASLSADLSALFNDAAGTGHLRARWARKRLERWLTLLVRAEREASAAAQPAPSLFRSLVMFRALDSTEPLEPRVAAVELLNLMRPIVAVSVYIVWMAHALRCRPDIRACMESGEPQLRKAFVEEVRRFYPFFPAVMAKVAEPFSWGGQDFEEGARVLLDLHGTKRDPRHWHEPDRFRPERFLNEQVDTFAFIPQGGGDVANGHRCPGEGATVALMLASIDFLLGHLATDEVEPDETEISSARMPALPEVPIYI